MAAGAVRASPRTTRAARQNVAPYPANRPNETPSPIDDMIHPNLESEALEHITTAMRPRLSEDETDSDLDTNPEVTNLAEHETEEEVNPLSPIQRPEIQPAQPTVLPNPANHRLEGVQTLLRLSESEIQAARHWATFPQQEQTMVTAMYLVSINHRIDRLLAQGANVTRDTWHKDFRTFIRTQIRDKLLQSDLMSYGRTHTLRNHVLISRSPLLLVKAEIDAMPEDWKKSYLPAGYLRNNHEDIVKVSNFIRELLKYEKSALAKMIMTGARQGRRTSQEAVPTLDSLIVKILQTFSPTHGMMSRADIVASIDAPMKVRIGFLRLHMYMQRQQDRTTTQVRSPWEVIDRHLETLRTKSRDYKVVFGRLILSYNSHLFDGLKTATDVAGIVVALPSEEEVQDMLLAGAQAPDDEEHAAEGELF